MPCNPAAETALRPPIWCFGSSCFHTPSQAIFVLFKLCLFFSSGCQVIFVFFKRYLFPDLVLFKLIVLGVFLSRVFFSQTPVLSRKFLWSELGPRLAYQTKGARTNIIVHEQSYHPTRMKNHHRQTKYCAGNYRGPNCGPRLAAARRDPR